jgi:hypothetical protein
MNGPARIIIDTDPGVDDAIAILMALACPGPPATPGRCWNTPNGRKYRSPGVHQDRAGADSPTPIITTEQLGLPAACPSLKPDQSGPVRWSFCTNIWSGGPAKSHW